jgi:exopolyphosphatase/pppGpp-phosphohydrolase
MRVVRATPNPPLTAQRRIHREEVARAQASLQRFIECLRQLPYREGTHTPVSYTHLTLPTN